MTAARRTEPWFVVAILAETAIFAADAITGDAAIIAPLLFPPLIGALVLSWRRVAAVAVYAVGLALLAGILNGFFGSTDHLVRVGSVVLAGVLGMWISWLRVGRERAGARLGAQYAVATALNEAASLAEATPRLLEAIAHTLDWDVGAIWEVRPGTDLHCANVWQARGSDFGTFVELTRTTTFARGIGLPGRVWASGEPAWVPDVAVDENFPRAAAAAAAGIHSAFAFPIRGSEGELGVVEFFSARHRPAEADVLELVKAFGSQMGQFIERKRAERSLASSEALKTAILGASLDAVITIDQRGRVLEFNSAAEATFGYTRAEAVGKEMAVLIIPPSYRDAHRRALARYVATGEARLFGQRLELTGMHRDGHEFPVELTITRINVQGPPIITGFVRDITERQRAEEERARALEHERMARARAERDERRAAFLAEAGTLLDASLEFETTLKNLAEISVPELADWCVVDIVDDDGSLRRLAVAHVDPAKEQLAWDLHRRYPPLANDEVGAPAVVRTGEPQLLTEIPDELLRRSAREEEHLRIARELGLKSAMIVPLRARGRTFGALTFVSAESGRRYGTDDLAHAQDLARRAGLAISNARLYSERAYIARTLQRSLLPPLLPDIPGIDAAARFHAAGEGNEVGGDFYDLFETSNHDWAGLIGDVCGKGPDAAAVTAIARYTLRAASMQEERPSRVLTILNDALLTQRADKRFCTVAYTRLHRRNGEVQLELSSGGHPLPLILRTDGTVEDAGEFGTLLGIVPELALSDQTVNLRAGDAIVLYTDGVTEARGPGGAFGPERLAELLSSCAGLEAAAIAERIESAVLGIQEGDPRDDIAIVVLRVRE